MFNKLKLVWIIAGRELKDQLRDWRVLAPMIILTLGFPVLTNEFAKQAVDFFNKYNGNLILDRLVPISIMIIGFFPITISLLVALEAFVGEKERGTIEPILSAPLDDWQLYFGKLLVGVATPLVSSYLSIILYLIFVSRQNIEMPPFSMLAQLFFLTTAHAVLMVSAAIVISVQSTSVKAANLLASFIVVPVAILMQGEAAVLFWGNGDVLWMVVLAVLIISLLLMRVGIAHFQREYLLGREIDVFNLSWVWRTFRGNFLGNAQSLGEWYRIVLGGVMRRILPAIVVMLLIAGVSIWISYDWVMVNGPKLMEGIPSEKIEEMVSQVGDMPDLANLLDRVNAPYLFLNNTRAMIFMALVGSVSFSVLGVLLYIINIGLIGGLFAVLQLLGLNVLPIFVAGVLPHGIFEIPALIISSAMVLYMGASIVTPQTGKSMGEVVLELFADWAKVFLGLIIPLLAIASVIEAYITPSLLLGVLK